MFHKICEIDIGSEDFKQKTASQGRDNEVRIQGEVPSDSSDDSEMQSEKLINLQSKNSDS